MMCLTLSVRKMGLGFRVSHIIHLTRTHLRYQRNSLVLSPLSAMRRSPPRSSCIQS